MRGWKGLTCRKIRHLGCMVKRKERSAPGIYYIRSWPRAQDAVIAYAAIRNGKVGSQNPSDSKARVIYSEQILVIFMTLYP